MNVRCSSATRLPSDAFDALVHFLPNAYWWKEWDVCRRLRVAVVNAYVKAELDPRSFLRLTSDSAVWDSLADIAFDTGREGDFMTRVFDGTGQARK
jgi:hypothetical protein